MRGDAEVERYLREVERVRSEILSVVREVNPRIVADIGVGEFTLSLAHDIPSLIVTIDVDCNKLELFHANASAEVEAYKLELVCADALHIPLRSSSVDIAVFHFTLHEIDPSIHPNVLSSAGRVSSYTLVVEPTPYGDELYAKLWSIWRDVARFLGGYEEYKQPDYWLKLLDEAGLQVLKSKNVKWKGTVPYKVLENMAASWVDEWKRNGVPDHLINALRELLEEAKMRGFRWSDIYVVLASRKGISEQA